MPTFVSLPKPRHRVEQTAQQLRITLPSRRNWLTIIWLTWPILLLLYMLTMLGVGMVMLLLMEAGVSLGPNPPQSLSSDGRLILGIFKCAGAVFILWASVFLGATIYSWLWEIAGREIIVLDAETLGLQKQIFGWAFTERAYARLDVLDLRVVSLPPKKLLSSWLSVEPKPKERIAFDYGAKTFHFGEALDEAEAKQIVATMHAYWKATH